MKVVSWNVNSLNVRLPHLQEWMADVKPDVVCLQETKMDDPKFPEELIRFSGYEVVFSGQKAYNGVAIISRKPAQDVLMDIPGLEDPQRRVLAATIDGIRIINLYVPNGQEVGSEKYAYKLDWLAKLHTWLKQETQKYERMVVVGDFNIAPDNRDVWNPDAWVGRILCSDAERQALRNIQDLGFIDLFRRFEQPENAFSWWDYRGNMFGANKGLRIDLVLTTDPMTKSAMSCVVDNTPRAWARPSDHAPVVAEFS